MRRDSYLAAAALPFGYAAALVLVFMMLFTTYAVIMRQVFDTPILGVIDVMELALVVCIFMAMPGVFLRDEHVVVDVIDQMVSPRTVRGLRMVGLILTLGFLVLMITYMVQPALEKLDQHEVTMTLGINRFVHWIPIIFGFVLSIAATVWVIVHYVKRGMPSQHPGGDGGFE
ncbi:MAG: TRAP transporter small permease [Alphaproteobacteria bacterium]|nr:TRAP transporter small permease [Alphaproteobacteria bacterium]